MKTAFLEGAESGATQRKAGPQLAKRRANRAKWGAIMKKEGACDDAGTHASIQLLLKSLPTEALTILRISEITDTTSVYQVRVTPEGALQLWNDTVQIGPSSSPLSTGVWHRISLAFTVTSLSANEAQLSLDDNPDITVSNATLSTTGSSVLSLGCITDLAGNNPDLFIDY